MSSKSPGQKSVLILGTNAGQADLIKHMKGIGWYVHACSRYSGEVGEQRTDAFHRVDIIDTEAVIELARHTDVDLVYSISSDLGIMTSVTVSEVLELPHFFNSGLIEILRKKHRLRGYLNDHDLGPVQYQVCDGNSDVSDWDTFPCVVKPTDSQGQRGVLKIDDAHALEFAVEEARGYSPTNMAIIEQYLEGPEISCHVLLQDGRYAFNLLSDRLVHSGRLMGIPRGHRMPCQSVSPTLQAEALQLVRDTVDSLGIDRGCLYFQMKATEAGVRIIEITPRLDGCHMWRLIKAVTGRDYLAETMAYLLAEPTETTPATIQNGVTAELVFQQAPPGDLFSVEAFPVPDGVLYHEYRYTDDERIRPINGKHEVTGYYVRIVDPQNEETRP